MAKKDLQFADSPLPGALSKGERDILPKLSLRGIRLLSMQAEVSIKNNEHPTNAFIQTAANVSGPHDRDLIFVDVSLSVVAKPPSGGDDCSVMSLTADYQCIYYLVGLKHEALKSHATDIADIGVRVAWPYLRELVSSTTLKMGIPPVTLPFIGLGNEANSPIARLPAKKKRPAATKKAKKGTRKRP
jgi:preprotein translocase subunit SecB